MDFIFKKIIRASYYALFFIVPLIFVPTTSELFEFNKMVAVYLITTVVVSAWISRMLVRKEFVFKRTFLDTFLLLFLGTQLLSTLFSVDFRTSLLGYYSRFHGGLLSSFSYSLLYWAYVSNLDKKATLRSIYSLCLSALIVSIWGILEHFGRSISCLMIPPHNFDVACWVQDVQNRVYATLGQPNWMAAYLTAIIPITWALAVRYKISNLKFILWSTLSVILMTALFYTKSRSGILGFAVGMAFYWLVNLYFFIKQSSKRRKIVVAFLTFSIPAVILFVAVGIPGFPSLSQFIGQEPEGPDQGMTENETGFKAPALETAGTESGTIRKIVWTGAIDIWKAYPILGTGVETFAYSYYKFRPAAHNLVSEWDFLYNKAHNEYLNFAATTGTLGLLSYLALAIAIAIALLKDTAWQFRKKSKDFLLPAAFLGGIISILVSNFFGFSVVPVALLYFLYPALSRALAIEEKNAIQEKVTASPQKIGLALIAILTFYLLFNILKYWYADYVYAQGKLYNDAGSFVTARQKLDRAVKLSPNEAVYWSELSQASGNIAAGLAEEENIELAREFAESAITESKRAVELSPANVNIKRNRAATILKLYSINPQYMLLAQETLEDAVERAPTEAKLVYNLGLVYLRSGNYERAIEIMKEAVELKPNYYNARYALALMYIDEEQPEPAKEQLNYILDNINPDDERAKQELEELNSQSPENQPSTKLEK